MQSMMQNAIYSILTFRNVSCRRETTMLKVKAICKTVLMYAVLTAVMVLMASVDAWVNLI